MEFTICTVFLSVNHFSLYEKVLIILKSSLFYIVTCYHTVQYVTSSKLNELMIFCKFEIFASEFTKPCSNILGNYLWWIEI